MSDPVFIGLNKQKARITSISMGVLAIASLMMFWWYAENQDYADPAVFKTIGVIFCILLVLVGAAAAKKASDKKAGVLFDERGITDTTSSISIGLVKWKDIKEMKSDSSGMLIVHVKSPEKYLKAAGNSAIKRLLTHNNKMYNTPVVINSSYIEGSIEELENVATEQYNLYVK